MEAQSDILVLAGTLLGGIITGTFSLVSTILDKRQRKTEVQSQISIEKKKLFAEAQRQKAVHLCEQLELFRQLEEKYIDEVISLRTELNRTSNKQGSIKTEFRDKVNDEENRIEYKKSDYLRNKSFFVESQSYYFNIKGKQDENQTQ